MSASASASARGASPRERRRREDVERRRADVLAAASSVFAAKGFHESQMSEIAASAEVARNTLYALFESKENLYEETIAVAHERIRSAVEERANALDDPRERLLSVIDSLFRCYDENADLLRIYARGTHGLPTQIRGAMGESSLRRFQSFTDWVIELARHAKRAGYLRGLDAETVGISLVGTVTTTAARWVELTPERSLDDQASNVRRQFARLLGADASEVRS
jgi:AcrR family transcriptional regulator